MSLWTLEPRDPLVVRDGRPNSGKSESRTLPFPYPGTIAGLLRTRLGSDAEGVFDPDQDPAPLRRVALRGPLLARLEDGRLYAPPPRDAVLAGEALRRLVPRDRPEGAIFDAGFEGDLVVLSGEGAAAKRARGEAPAFWPLDLVLRWLADPDRVRAEEVKEQGLGALPEEVRRHVKIGESGAAEEGMLFQTKGLRFTTAAGDRLALAFDVDEASFGGRSLRAGIGPAGGERRLARWSPAPDRSLPALPEAVREAVGDRSKERVRVRVALLTPAIFEAGHRPGRGEGQLLGEREGVRADLAAMCVPRPETISGWDFVKGSPKRSRRVVPAGSVYWIDLSGPADGRVRWAEEVMMDNVSDADQDRRDGFGLAAVGLGGTS